MPPALQKIVLNFTVFGQPFNNVFFVEIAKDATVMSLKTLIHEVTYFGALPAQKLVLFDVDLPGPECEDLGVGDFKHKIECAIENKQSLDPLRQMCDIFHSIPGDHIHVVVRSPAEAQNTVIKNLRSTHAVLFELLQVQVLGFGLWSDDDIKHNMGGGEIFAPNHPQLPAQLARIEAKLVQTRTYSRPPDQDWWPGFRIASDHPKHAQLFQDIYVEKDSLPVSVMDDQEFFVFSNILERYQEDLINISLEGSSSLKASHFKVHFTVPPFFNESASFEYKEKTSLVFPVFLAERRKPELFYISTPTPGFTVTSTSTNCPLVTSEVASDPPKESDRRRMLLQAIALARAGQYLVKANEQFFVVAIYLRADMTAQRYLVAQTENNKVFMCQKDFNLCLPGDSVSFLREMYNLAAELEILGGKFDPGKAASLEAIDNLAERLPSLSEMQRHKELNDFVMGARGLAAGGKIDGSGVFGADDIQAILQETGSKIKFIPLRYPMIAVVSSVIDDSEIGFLKFVPGGRSEFQILIDQRDEIQILKHLSEIDSPQNHTVTGVRVWPIRGGHVISMPSVGSWLTHLETPDEHLWSVAGQLFEAIDFMHQHGVAHLDLKPANILIPPDGGRLSIIDYNTSVWTHGVGAKFSGVVGTRGYIAPEAAAGHGEFSALRADLWSCGKTLSELCNLCRPSADRKALLQVAQALTDKDPKKRPMMSEVLKWMADCNVDGDTEMSEPRFARFGSSEMSG